MRLYAESHTHTHTRARVYLYTNTNERTNVNRTVCANRMYNKHTLNWWKKNTAHEKWWHHEWCGAVAGEKVNTTHPKCNFSYQWFGLVLIGIAFFVSPLSIDIIWWNANTIFLFMVNYGFDLSVARALALSVWQLIDKMTTRLKNNKQQQHLKNIELFLNNRRECATK